MKTLSPHASPLLPQAAVAQQPLSLSRAPTVPISPLTIGARLRTARISANQSQWDLAGGTFSKGYISGLERGKLTPSFQALRTLAQRLGVSVSYLLGEVASDLSMRGAPREALQARPESEEAPAAQTQEGLRGQVEDLLRLGRYEEAIALAEQAGAQEVVGVARAQYGHFLASQGRLQEAYEQMRFAYASTRHTRKTEEPPRS